MNEFSKKPADSGHHWISISDMMSGLMMVFLFIAVSYMINVIKQKDDISAKKEKVDEIVRTYEEKQKNILNDLKKEFEKDEAEWGAKVQDDLSIRFSINEDPALIQARQKVFFKVGNSLIEKDFKVILNDFSPRYFKIMDKYRDVIEEIRIEGHSSSEGLKDSLEEPYIYNMGLSQARTREVLKYILNLKQISDKRDWEWIKEKLTANGLSSSKPLPDKENEDKEKSRRVEFRVKTNAETQIMKIIEELK